MTKLGSPALHFALALAAASTFQTSTAQAQQLTDRVSPDVPTEDTTAWALSAGGVFNSGNTQSYGLNVGTNASIVRGRHGVGASWTFNIGGANLPDDMVDEYIMTSRNSNARLRYDFYLTKNDALFVALAHRWDTFAGLDTRLQGQVGYMRNFLNVEKHRAWGEIGYDITYDNFDPERRLDPDQSELPTCMGVDAATAPDECLADGSQVVHAARLYLGYDNQLSEAVRFLTGIEALLNLQQVEDLRLNFDAALQTTIAGSLQVELKFKLLYDNVPALRADGTSFEKVDTLTTFSLIYTFI